MLMGGGQAMHAPPTWPQVARVAAGLRGNGNASFRALRAPPLKRPSTRFSHGYLLSAQVRVRETLILTLTLTPTLTLTL